MLTDCASLIAAARSAAADPHGTKPAAFEWKDSSAALEGARNANATRSGREERCTGTTQMSAEDTLGPEA